MNDEAVYGKVSYRLPFSAAVAAGIIVPYKVIISVSLNKEVDAELLRRGSTRVRRDEIQAKWVANQIALKRAIEKTGASKIITFHSRVNLAEEFAGDNARGFQEHVKGFEVFHVNGGQNAADRKALLEDFKASPRGLITNARCLTEGVDVPAVDMVAFVDPRKSKIDIAQAAGRAMRQSKATNKKLGYIVVPLFIEQKKGETEAEAFTRAGFDEVAEVLGAMLESDDDLVDTIKELQEARGRGEKFNPRQLHEKIEVIGPAINLDKLTQSIDVEILERLGLSWDRWFGLLQKFRKREGHCHVTHFQRENGLNLGHWVAAQRVKRRLLDASQISRLNSLNFTWDAFAEQWETSFETLKHFAKNRGHCRVPFDHVERGFKLGNWVHIQRTKKSNLDVNRISKLDEIGFIWDVHEELWSKGFSSLTRFRRREGHCRVNTRHVEDGFKLGAWTINLRSNRSSLSQERINQLDRINFVWNSLSDKWGNAFRALCDFKEREGHCRIPDAHNEAGIKLGNWAKVQRRLKDRMPHDRLEMLEAIGFSWNPSLELWDAHFQALNNFKKREGHCRVPISHEENGLKIGAWSGNLRTNKAKLGNSRIQLLDSLGFVWDMKADQWETNMAALEKLCRLNKGLKIHSSLVVDGLRVGMWLYRQHRNLDSLSPQQIRRIKSIEFINESADDIWDLFFEKFKEFVAREGHSIVVRNHIEGGIKLGSWVQRQRQTRNSMPKDRANKLKAFGFTWDPISVQWDLHFAAVLKF